MLPVFYRRFLRKIKKLKITKRRTSCGKFRDRNLGIRRKTRLAEILRLEFLCSIRHETVKEQGFDFSFTFKISRSLSGCNYTVIITLLPFLSYSNFVVCMHT
jgi:hypothetical protein